MATTAARLTIIQDAIDALATGAQSYTIGARTLTRANLKDLMEQEKYLEAKLRREIGGANGGKALAELPDAQGSSGGNNQRRRL